MARNLRVGIQRGLRQSIGGGLGTGDIFTLSPASFDFSRTNTKDSRITFTRASSGTFVDADGLIKSAATNTPRFDHDPVTGKSLGLLIEESSTNRNTKSKSFSVWGVSSGFSLVYDAATAPDGTTSATALDRNGSGLARLEKNFSVGSGGSTTFSVFAKSVNTTTGRYLRLAVNDAQTGERFADFDLVDGTIDVAATNGGNFTNAASRIEEYPNDWYRCSLSFSKTSSGSENSICFHKLYIRQSNNSTDTPSGVTDVGMHLWGGQVEEKTFPTSLIETDGSTVTRAADVVEITGTNFSSFYSQSEGTFFSDLTGSGGFGFVAHNGSNANRHGFAIATGTLFTSISETSNHFGVAPTLVAGGGKLAYGYKANDYNAFGDGVNLPGTSPTTLPTGINELALGYRGSYSANSFLNGHIKRLSYFPTRLADATLQSITS